MVKHMMHVYAMGSFRQSPDNSVLRLGVGFVDTQTWIVLMVSQKWYTILTEISGMNLIWVRSSENLLHPLNLVLTHSESGNPIVAHQSTSTRKLVKWLI